LTREKQGNITRVVPPQCVASSRFVSLALAAGRARLHDEDTAKMGAQ